MAFLSCLEEKTKNSYGVFVMFGKKDEKQLWRFCHVQKKRRKTVMAFLSCLEKKTKSSYGVFVMFRKKDEKKSYGVFAILT